MQGASLLFKEGPEMYFWLSTLKPSYDFTTMSFLVMGQYMGHTLELNNYLRKKNCVILFQLNL